MIAQSRNCEQKSNFTGKGHNNHSQWHDQPLRLTEEQRHNPHLVFKDFFIAYHLRDSRELLWEWFSAVICSSNFSGEPHERSAHIYFYENLEKLIEASFLLKKRISHHRPKRKNRFNSDRTLAINKANRARANSYSDQPRPAPAAGEK